MIRNGTVKNFGYGVMLTGGTTFNVVENLTLDGHMLAGMELNDADDGRNGNTIRNNLFTNNGEAALSLINGTEGTLVENNEFMSNGGVGFQLIEADRNRFEGNEMSGISFNPNIDSDAGANLEFSTENEFVDNYFNDFGDAGLVITESSHRNLVEGNTLVRSGDAGVYIQDSEGNARDRQHRARQLRRRRRRQPGQRHGRARQRRALQPERRRLLELEQPASSRTTTRSHSLQTGFELGNGANLVVRNNVANLTGGAGISIESGLFDTNGLPVGGALIEGNTANENAETGIAVADGGHRSGTTPRTTTPASASRSARTPSCPASRSRSTNIDGPPPGTNRASGNGRARAVQPASSASRPAPRRSRPLDIEPPETQILTGPPRGDTRRQSSATFTFTGDRQHHAGDGDDLRVPARRRRPIRRSRPIPIPSRRTPTSRPTSTRPTSASGSSAPRPFHIPMLEQGPHHLEVRAIDNAENMDLTHARWEWEIDITVPDELGGDDASRPTRSSRPARWATSSAPRRPSASRAATT